MAKFIARVGAIALAALLRAITNLAERIPTPSVLPVLIAIDSRGQEKRHRCDLHCLGSRESRGGPQCR